MTKVLFVCYRHGCGGEYLSHKISTHKLFKTLEIRTVNNRTIITNDFFNKQLLSRNNWLPDIPKLPTDYNIVVPSHYFYDILKDYLPNAYFVSIDVPEDLKKFRQQLFDRYWKYNTKNMLELAGECESRYYQYHPQAQLEDIKQFTTKIFMIKNVTFGDIHCLANELDSTDENKKMLLNSYTPSSLSAETKQNSFIIPYEKVHTIDVEEIITYIKRSNK